MHRSNDPYINRFSQPDTIVPDQYNQQTLNRYSYANGNPIKNDDPSGHCASGAIIDTIICVTVLAGAFLILNSTNDSYQPNLSSEELKSRQISYDAGVALTVSALSVKSWIVETLSNAYDCVTGVYCDPQSFIAPGSAGLYTNTIEDAADDLPRLTTKQINQLDDLASPSCPIVLCGGYAENSLGLYNRTIAFEKNRYGDIYINDELLMPYWRNTSNPIGNDFDYWTPRGTDYNEDIISQLEGIFNTNNHENYNKWHTELPPGSVIFWGNGTYSRKPARWQNYIEWGDFK